MEKNSRITEYLKTEYIIFFIAIILCYFNVIQRPQIYYDDYTNIFTLRLLGDGFNFHSLINSMKINISGFRPISYLSFYLNHYLSHGNIKSFILVNILIHFANTIVFYKIALKLTNHRQTAFLTALFWCVAPVNLFAVTYLVQRMTSLMALFGGIGTLYYLDWEEKKNLKNLIAALIFVGISILCKENGILFIGFFLIHYYIKNGNDREIKILYITGFLFLIFLFFFSKNYFAAGYIKRATSPLQRFLTEMRVLVFYLQNIIFPLANKIYLFSDLKPSSGLLKPITTLLSLAFLIFLIVFSYAIRNKDKILTISILSFFLFHSVESTFFPLYRVFFHRNYTASFFVILAFIYLITKVKSPIKKIVIAVLIINSMWITITHNLKWAYKPYYIEKNYECYPNNTVSKTKFAMQLEKQGKLNKALNLYLELLKTKQRTWAFIGTVNIFRKAGLNREAISLANLYPKKDPELLRIMALSYANLNDFDNFIKYYKKSLDMSFSLQNFIVYLSLLYKRNLYDSIVFETEKYSPRFKQYYINNNRIMEMLFNTKILFTRIALLNLECKLRINLESRINEDITMLKKHGLYNSNIENYITALIETKKGNYSKALNELNRINIKFAPTKLMFLYIKKVILTLCIYEKTGEEEKFKELIEKFSKNTIIYDSIWQELDKCY